MQNRRLRILITSNTPWNDNNSFGSSFSNIFGGNPNYEIANIYCQSGLPDTQVCSRFYRIDERSIIRSILHPKYSSGKEVENCPNTINRDGVFVKKVKVYRWQIMFWVRDLVWATGRWRSSDLDKFIDGFNPDVIFQPIYYQPHIARIGLYAQQRTRVPMIGYISDDNYTLKQFSLSPLFWIDRLVKRRYVKHAIDRCSILYTITEKQRNEYNVLFGNKCKLLYKGGDFSSKFTYEPNDCLRFVYTGNLGMGRWKSLAQIAAAIERENRESVKAQLFIYSATPLTNKMSKKLNRVNTSFCMGTVPSKEVSRLQRDADVLVHVESFELSERYKARLSFSTKIVDYLSCARCIFAVGWSQTGGIEYLSAHNAAIVATDPVQISQKIHEMLQYRGLIKLYAEKSFLCGRRFHRLDEIREGLYRDILQVVDDSRKYGFSGDL